MEIVLVDAHSDIVFESFDVFILAWVLHMLLSSYFLQLDSFREFLFCLKRTWELRPA
jgi:hypothetical protein